MNENQMKPLLLRDKEFLKSLYESQSLSKTKNILNFASDAKLNTLIKFLHMVSNGQIKIKKEHFNKLQNKHIKLIKKHFESKSTFLRILREERKVKVNILIKFSDIFHEILFTLFNQLF